MKHTKGPWYFVYELPNLFMICNKKEDKFNEVICTMCNNKQEYDNAKLIAAAPDMLEALLAVNKYFVDLQNKCALTSHDKRAWKLTAKAIKRATQDE